jgi:hypothetical protein
MRTYVSLVLALIAAGCTTSDVDEVGFEASGGVRNGVDYSWGRPSPQQLHALGYTFAARYLSHDTSGKNITAAEAQALHDAGIDVVLNWESSGTAALHGYAGGVADATAARDMAAAIGAPAGIPIYFSVDFNPIGSQVAVVDSYFDGVAAVLGVERVGAYGGFRTISHLFDTGRISYGWQTYAWSYGQWDPRAQARQVHNGIQVAGGLCDLDVAMAQDFGQWGNALPDVLEFAFQANTTSLWTVGPLSTGDWHLGMMPGTSPSITNLKTGGFEVAFQANTGSLWTVGTAGNRDWGLGMMAGTSPSITALEGGGFEVAFQANTGNLWTAGDAGTGDWHLGMMAGSSPSIAGLVGGGFEVAFEANTTSLWTVGDAGNRDWQLGMMSGTSPAIAALAGGGFEVAFEANTTSLWTVGDAGNSDWSLGMLSGTSPAICGLAGGGFEVAFQANTTSLWTVGDAGNKDWQLGMMAGTNPSISCLPTGGFEAAFQANTSSLWKAGDAGTGPLDLGMAAGTSPAGS